MSGPQSMAQSGMKFGGAAQASSGPPAIRPPGDAPEAVPFLFSQQRRRLPGAMVISFLLNVSLVVLAISVPHWGPTVYSTAVMMTTRSTDPSIIWLRAPGPGGGGGGGGNRSPEPPRRLEMPGEDPLSVPVAKPLNLQNPDTKKVTPQDLPQELTIPARELASGALTVPGALDSALGSSLSSLGPGSGGGAGTGTGTGIGPGDGSGLGPGSGGGYGGGVYRPGAGIENPVVLREVKPGYTAEAMRAKIQGVVWLEGVVRPDGTLTDIKVVRSLDPVYGLDQEAVKAARQWRFVPGKRFGQPVAVAITIEMTFTLH